MNRTTYFTLRKIHYNITENPDTSSSGDFLFQNSSEKISGHPQGPLRNLQICFQSICQNLKAFLSSYSVSSVSGLFGLGFFEKSISNFINRNAASENEYLLS